MCLSSSLPPTHLSTFSIDMPSVAALAEPHVAKNAVQGKEFDDVETEQGTRLLGHLLFPVELCRCQNCSSLRSPYTGLRYRRCFGTDSRRNIAHSCRIFSAFCSVIL